MVGSVVVEEVGPNDRNRAQKSGQKAPRAMISVSNITKTMYFICSHREGLFYLRFDRQYVTDGL